MHQKIALVTGANRGIGLEVCRQLLAKNCLVILTSRNIKKGEMAIQSLGGISGSLHYHQLDINDQESISTIKTFVSDQFGRLDILINNAAINFDAWHTALHADLNQAQQTVEANVFGTWRMCQAFLPMMQAKNYGRVVNVSSISGSLANIAAIDAIAPAYSISKAGLNVLTIQLAKLVAGKDILINAIGPGWCKTDMGTSIAPRNAAEGAASILWGAMLPTGGPTGGFFRDGKRLEW